MGFCRRCGEIVAGVRCKCGGTAVAPVIAWKHSNTQSGNQDKWSKTYVSSTKSNSTVKTVCQDPNPTTSSTTTIDVPPSVTTKRFPRPNSTPSVISPALKSGVSSHITLATTQSPRPPSPLKFSTTISDSESDILPSLLPNEPTLSKVYGSVLQPTETLTLYSCAICSAVFPPDTTIYPNPCDSDSNSFLCRSCFTTNGGSKGICPSCSRPVLTLKSEGGFVHSTGKYWHKQCFNCTGCFKNIGDSPLVDLLGRPSCVDCFDNCLNRDPTTPRKSSSSNNNSPIPNNPGGLNASYGRKSRENSPALEELEQRLGIVKSREGSPSVGDGSPKLLKSSLAGFHQIRPSLSISDKPQPRSPSPDRRSGPVGEVSPLTSRTTSAQDIDQTTRVKRRTSRLSNIPRLVTPPRTGTQSIDNVTLKSSNHTKGNGESLSKDFIEEKPTALHSQASGETNASSNVRPSIASSSMISHLAKSNNTQGEFASKGTSLSKLNLSTSPSCAQCKMSILNPREGGQFIGIPGIDENATPQTYHPECFKCAICDKPLNEPKKSQVTFVRCDTGPCHAQCAPAKSVVVYKMGIPKPVLNVADVPQPITPMKTPVNLGSSMLPPSSRYERPLVKSPSSPSKPRFGGQATCPGCHKSVSLMEWGVIPGPQGTRWHASCLVCGGKREITAARQLGRRREAKDKGEPGCGKKLDSAARSDSSGGVWCRECLLLLGLGGSPQSSPTRGPLVPSFTGTGKIVPQYTGTTTIARQFTGLGGGDPILRQLTGGGLSPTRSISPTKQLGTPGLGGGRPRPKSVIGMRSIDEGRGMYLVKQLTGSNDQ